MELLYFVYQVDCVTPHPIPPSITECTLYKIEKLQPSPRKPLLSTVHWTESEFWKKEAPLGVGEGVHPLHDHRTLAGGNTHGTRPAFRIPVTREIGIYNACQEAAKDKGLYSGS